MSSASTSASAPVGAPYHFVKSSGSSEEIDATVALDDAACTVFSALKAPIHILSLFGDTKNGKSFLGSHLAMEWGCSVERMFKDSDDLDSETVGAWFATIPHPTSGGTIVVIDCEGSGSTDSGNPERLLRLMSTIGIVSSVVLYVEGSRTVQQRCLDGVASMIGHIIAADAAPDVWPVLYIALNRKDGSFSGNPDTWLQNKLSNYPIITSRFTSAHLCRIPTKQVDENAFNAEIKSLASSILRDLTVGPFKVGSVPGTGSMIVDMFKSTIDSLKDVKIAVKSPFDSIADDACSNSYSSAKAMLPSTIPDQELLASSGDQLNSPTYNTGAASALNFYKTSARRFQACTVYTTQLNTLSSDIAKLGTTLKSQAAQLHTALARQRRANWVHSVLNGGLSGGVHSLRTAHGRVHKFELHRSHHSSGGRPGYFFKVCGTWFQISPDNYRLRGHPGGADDWETFFIFEHPSEDGSFCFKGMLNGLYMADEPDGTLNVNRSTAQSWERFWIDE